jgi:hypothetical protein
MVQHLICCLVSAVVGFGLSSVLHYQMSGGWTILFIGGGIVFTVLTQQVGGMIKK